MTYRNSTRRPTVSASAAAVGPARASAWRCCSSGARRRHRGDGGSAQNRGGVSADRSGESSAAGVAFMLGDAVPVFAVTTAGLRSRLAGHDLPIIDVVDALSGYPGTPPPMPAASEPRLRLYTSGTTGEPKGVGITIATSPRLFASLPGTLVGGAGVVAVSFLWPGARRSKESGARCWVVATGDRARSRWRPRQNDFHGLPWPNTSAC